MRVVALQRDENLVQSGAHEKYMDASGGPGVVPAVRSHQTSDFRGPPIFRIIYSYRIGIFEKSDFMFYQ